MLNIFNLVILDATFAQFNMYNPSNNFKFKKNIMIFMSFNNSILVYKINIMVMTGEFGN